MGMLRIVTAAIIGNSLEVYDMVIYGYFASTIAANFFPKQDKLVGIASAFVLFFIGYLARPVGALFLGRIGDTLGRKPALLLSIWLMAISTCAIGLLPTYATLGVWAPLLLLLLRLLQGFSFGGEYIGSIIFLVEHAPKKQRGFYGSFGDTGGTLGLLFSPLIASLIYYTFDNVAAASWAWRLPFLLGTVVGIVGWYARRNLGETSLFREKLQIPDTHFDYYREYVKELRPMAIIIGLVLFDAVSTYLFYVFIFTYMTTQLQYTRLQALNINMFSIVFLLLLQPWMGKLSDHIGRRPVLAFSLVATLIWIWPYFWLMQQHSVPLAFLAQGVITLFVSGYVVTSITIVEIVPVYLRFSAVAFAYAVAASIFGGITPLVATLLLEKTGSAVSLAALVSVCGLISLFAVYKVQETRYAPKSIEQSIEESISQIARNRLVNGDNVQKVAAITGFSENEVESLKP